MILKMLSKKIKIMLLLVTVFGIAFLAVVNFTDACRLDRVYYNDTEIENFGSRFGLQNAATLTNQPVDSIVQRLLSKRNIFKVDVEYDFPEALKIRTNNFNPACFILDKFSGKLYGINDNCRVVELVNCNIDWERPVLTTVGVKRVFEYCDDIRVNVVMEQLEKLRDDNMDLYRLVDEIDFGNSSFLKVSISGLDYRLKVRAESFLDDLNRFVEFVSRFNPDLEEVELLDLRYEEMIICSRK